MSEKNQTPTQTTDMDQKSEYPSTLPTVGSEFINERQMSVQEITRATEVLAKVTAYTGAKAHTVDEFLNVPVAIYGAIQQPITLSKEVVDTDTGEVTSIPVPAKRTVCKLENGEVLSFVSKAADSFFENFIFPVFGKGDFPAPVKMKITQVSKGTGRTFNFSIVP